MRQTTMSRNRALATSVRTPRLEGMMPIRLLIVVAGTVLAGCSQVPFYRGNTAPAPGLRIASPTPQAAELVASLNANSQRVQAVQCADIDLDCQQGAQTVGLRGGLVCQKPRNFRLTAKVMGNVAVDIGSNDREF